MSSRVSSLLIVTWVTLALCFSLASALHHRSLNKVRVASSTSIPKDTEGKTTNLVSHAKDEEGKGSNGLVAEAVPMLPERNEAYDQAIFNDVGIHSLSHTSAGVPSAEDKDGGEDHELNRREDPRLHASMEHHDPYGHAIFDTQGTPGLDHSFEKEDHNLHAEAAPAHAGHGGQVAPAASAPAPAHPAKAKGAKHAKHHSEGAAEDTTLTPDYEVTPVMDEAEESEGAADEEGAQTANAAKLRLTTKKWSSCADKCKGESEITDALKAGKKTPQCCVDLIYETVLYVDRLLTRNKVTYWTMKGTLLGVVREKGVIQHDYDIDIGVLFRDINKIASLRDIIDKDGYVLLQAPWSGYNNMNFVIVKKTKAVRNHFKKNPVKPGKLPKFTKALREKAVSAELMVFEEMNGMLIQVLCTAPHPESPNLYAGKMDRKQMWSEYLQDEKAYQARAASETDGWLKYANGKDLPWVNYHKKFTKNVAPNCERTAPSSFKYEAPAAMVLPPKRLRYFSKTLAVPNDPHAYCTRYFGKDYMTPKRRYGL